MNWSGSNRAIGRAALSLSTSDIAAAAAPLASIHPVSMTSSIGASSFTSSRMVTPSRGSTGSVLRRIDRSPLPKEPLMPLKTPEEYVESLRQLKLRAYISGERVDSVVDSPLVAPHINTVAKTYELAHQPEHQDVMTAVSHLTGE